MKQKLLKLFILFVTMSVLTSSSKDSGTSKGNLSSVDEHSDVNAKSDYALYITDKPAAEVSEKNGDASVLSLADNEISLSPVSRFILVQ